ncbi:MAG: hypothetical protein PHR28_09595 [candidate division Zixibacteria bacterium]|nr:hypothetical protein [candidate division Zixibacteria bacterium]
MLLCPRCTDALGDRFGALAQSLADFTADTDRIVISCPGATLYLPDSDQVTAGVHFFDGNDPLQGYEIIGHPVYGSAHVAHRWVKRQDAHLIRRCQSCQDLTVRMRRKEGPDLFIPSRRHPRPQRSSRRYPSP